MILEEVTTESYVMACRHCERCWATTCEVRLVHDDAGERRLYFRDGVPIPALWSSPCPSCGDQRVTVVPYPITDASTAMVG